MEHTISDSSKQWLQDNFHIWELHRVGNFKYINNAEAKIFQSIAKEIDSDRYFSIYACDKCIQELVRFVFESYGESIEIESSEEVGEGTPTSELKPRKKHKVSI